MPSSGPFVLPMLLQQLRMTLFCTRYTPSIMGLVRHAPNEHVKFKVTVAVFLNIGRSGMDHSLIQNVHLLELFLCGALSGQLCHGSFKQAAEFHDPAQGVLRQVDVGDGTLHQIPNVRLLDKGAVSAAGFNQSLGGERLQGLPDRDTADLKNTGKFMFGRQALSQAFQRPSSSCCLSCSSICAERRTRRTGLRSICLLLSYNGLPV